MAIAAQRILIRAQVGARTGLAKILTDGAQQARAVLISAAVGANGTIPLRLMDDVRLRAGDVAERLFVGPDFQRVFTPDGAALAPIPQLINQWTAWETVKVVQRHSAFMTKRLPDDMQQWLRTARRPVAEITQAQAAARFAMFQPKPLVTYETIHGWRDANGFTLSDRIWRAGRTTRQRIDALIAEGIRNGDSAVAIANRLERFLRSDRAAFRTKTPYGQDGSFDARRLTRTEITHAFGQSMLISGKLNPFVTGIRWNLSPSHPRLDVCDSLAANGPYPVDRVPAYPAHPQCICHLSSETASIQDTLDALREMMNEGTLNPSVTPLDWELFAKVLLGELLFLLAMAWDRELEQAA